NLKCERKRNFIFCHFPFLYFQYFLYISTYFQMNSQERFLFEPIKLFVIVIFLIIAAFSNWIALAYIHDFIGRVSEFGYWETDRFRDPLPDIIFHFIDEQPWAIPLGDFMVMLCSISIILLFVFHKHRVVVIRRILFIIACLYSFRTLIRFCANMMLVTQLPAGYKNNEEKCRPSLNKTNKTMAIYAIRTLEQTIHVGMQDNSKQMLCGDYLFSGHSLIMIISALSISKYIDKSFKYLKWFPFCFAIIGVPCMVISRTHYTCDVIIALLASKALFYHAYCEIEPPQERKRSVLNAFCLTKIIFWLEENNGIDFEIILFTPQTLMNEFEIPFFGNTSWLQLHKETHRNVRDVNKSMSSNSSTTAAVETV
ncbi:PAP2_C domain-containing protein, partial [Meloidogyne graminicola]